MKELERVRWRCRRGLLELDIVLDRFVDRHYASLNEAQKTAFDLLLEIPDPVLWDMIANRRPLSPQSERSAVLELLQAV